MALQQVLLDGQPMASGEERRLLPGLDVSAYDRLHFHVSAGVRAVDELHVRVLFGTPASGVTLLADSTVWIEDTASEREFSHQAPTTGTTGFVLSVPVVAPQLFDVILTNRSAADKPTVYVAVFGQEI
ncbi:MAG TPA: hypothetical protein VE617_10570 [Propionibacteriaceae bacterium]|nr:hypothetical protein [Propionibacteriaceae bacterium]